jgi:hypothetical protein
MKKKSTQKITKPATPTSKRKPRATNATADEPPPITDATILRLYVLAGGRCSFPGCPAYLMEEPLTKRPARLANIAHIVAESLNGPRGDDPLPMARRSDIDNLMLVCTTHHLFVDKKEFESLYPVDTLRRYKQDHEARMKRATGSQVNEKTHAIRLVGQIRGNLVGLADDEIRTAVFEHEYRHVEEIIDIDVSTILDGTDPAYIKTVIAKIDAALQRQVLPQIENGTIKRLSAFALARIPFLAHFGFELGDKVPTVLYQKHRDGGEGWRWSAVAQPVDFEIVAHGPKDAKDVAVLFAVSGGDLGKVQRATNATRIFEIRPIGVTPSRTLLQSAATLENFRRTYHQVLARMEAEFPNVYAVDYFMATPAPVAVICGRDVLRDVLRRVVIHDLDAAGEYVPAHVLERRDVSSASVSPMASTQLPSGHPAVPMLDTVPSSP